MLDGLRSLFRAIERRAAPGSGMLADPWTSLLLGGGGPTRSGVSVSGESALRCTAVYGAVKVLSESVSQLPRHVYRTTAAGSPERATDHPLEEILNGVANPWTTGTELFQVMQTHLSLFGNAYAYVNRDSAGTIQEVIQLDARNVGVVVDPATMVPSYTYLAATQYQTVYDRRDLLHIRGIGTSLYEGTAPVSVAAEAIGLAIVMEQHAAGLFGKGARPGGIMETDRQLTTPVLTRMRASITESYEGGANGGRTMILEDGIKFKPLQFNSVDTQFLELRKFQIMEIARIFRVPLHMLADLERVTFSNAEAMGQQFISFCLLPILRLWTDAMRMTLLTPEERKAGFYIDFSVDEIARADLVNRFTAYSQAINAGIFNPNEARSMENLGPYKGGEVFTRPVNTSPVDKLGRVSVPIAEQPLSPNAGPVQPEANLVH